MKTREEYIQTTGEVIPEPQEFALVDLNSLDQLEEVFIRKQEDQGLTVRQTDLTSVKTFIDFLKGLLNLDPKRRWTP